MGEKTNFDSSSKKGNNGFKPWQEEEAPVVNRKKKVSFLFDNEEEKRIQARQKAEEKEKAESGNKHSGKAGEERMTPTEIYGYLDKYVWKQEKAKKAAAILAYKTFERKIRENAIFVGPTGCGKTYIWECMKSLYPNRIKIVDGSNLTQDGWKGSKKWNTLLEDPMFDDRKPAILVIDEADKMLAPRYTGRDENYAHIIASEGLKIIEGSIVDITEGCYEPYKVDTRKISFVLCGAFSVLAEGIAEQGSTSRIGFQTGARETIRAYEKPCGMEDLLEYGILPEFLGRFQTVVSLDPMTADDYYRIIMGEAGPIRNISRQYRAEVKISKRKCRELAKEAYKNGLGIRGLENSIREMVDQAMFADCSRNYFEF